MSNPVTRFKVKNIDEDRFGWAREAELGQKRLLTPSFATLVKSGTEFDTYIDIVSTYNTSHLGLCVIPVILAKTTTEIKIQKLKELKGQSRFEGGLASESLQNFFDKTVILIDPYAEYPYYEFQGTLDRMEKSLAIPTSLQELVSDVSMIKKEKKGDRKAILAYKENKYVEFWLDMKADPSKRVNFAKEFMNSESSRGASIGIPSAPVVTHNHTELFDVAVEMNRVCKALWKGECLTSIVLEQECISNSDFMAKVTQYIDLEDSHTIMKIKNFDLINSDMAERDHFRQFEESLAEIRKRRNKLAILLEAGPQAFPCAVYGWDVVSSSMRGLDMDGAFGKSKEKGWGGYLDPKWLNIRRFSEIKEMFENNGHKLPCPCEVCKSITDLKAVTVEFWNIARRKHFVLTMNNLMVEIAKNIKDRKIDLSYDRIANSELCPLKRIIPPH